MTFTSGLGNLTLASLESAGATERSSATPTEQGSKAVSDTAISSVALADTARVSGTSSALTQTTDSDVRFDRVAELKSAIASGNYQVSSSQIAEKIVNALIK